MSIHQGDIYWVPLDETDSGGSTIVHPHVVIQADVINQSRVTTVVVCALTTNMKRRGQHGYILLEAGEANLPKQSLVVVSQVSSVLKTQLGTYIGTLSAERVAHIFAEMKFLQSFTESG
jgi:mRNA interferase MazF